MVTFRFSPQSFAVLRVIRAFVVKEKSRRHSRNLRPSKMALCSFYEPPFFWIKSVERTSMINKFPA